MRKKCYPSKKPKGGDENGKASDASFSYLRAICWPEGA